MDPVFQWFGGKRMIANEVWKRLGKVTRYIEPFAGSAAVLLARPEFQGREVINDLDGYLVNFWRAVKADVEGVAAELVSPISELDLIARKRVFVREAESLTERLKADPKWYDREMAAWWFHGHSASVGNRWLRVNEMPNKFMPAMDTRSISDRISDLRAVQQRLVDVFILCGEWQRALDSEKVTFNGSDTVGIFFDPPYGAPRTTKIYADDRMDVAADVTRWCLEHGDDKRLRMVVAGYAGEHAELEEAGWTTHSWMAQGGHGNRRADRSNDNRTKETLWISPHCQKIEKQMQMNLWVAVDNDPSLSEPVDIAENHDLSVQAASCG